MIVTGVREVEGGGGGVCVCVCVAASGGVGVGGGVCAARVCMGEGCAWSAVEADLT